MSPKPKSKTALPTDFPPEDATDQTAPRARRWRNRIIGHGIARVDELLANPRNARIHPKSQSDALEGVLESVGIVQDVIVNQRTGFMLDGHLRVSLALRRGEPDLPVKYVDLNEAEEALVLATFDPIGALAIADTGKLDELITDIRDAGLPTTAGTDALLDALVAEVKEAVAEKTAAATSAAHSGAIFSLNEQVIFPSANRYGIPELRADMLAETWPTGIWNGVAPIAQGDDLLLLWGSNKFPDNAAGTGQFLGFYVDDERFESVWNDAVRIVGQVMAYGWAAAIAPDFSLWDNDPYAVQIWNHYRSAWVARYWQEAGVRIIPNLNRPATDDPELAEWLMAGFPTTCPVAAVQVRAGNNTAKDREREIRGLHRAFKYCKPDVLVVYGGETHREWLEPSLPHTLTPVWLSDFMTEARRARRPSESDKKVLASRRRASSQPQEQE